MKSLIAFKKRLALTLVALAIFNGAWGQVSQTNAAETALILEGEGRINAQTKKQTTDMAAIAALQGTMVLELTPMRRWESKYNSYLKTVQGYAETLKAGTMLYSEGVRSFMSLMEIKKAIDINPQGIGATLAINDLYVEVATEFLKTYNVIGKVAKGGETNMLNGTERTEMLWTLNDQLAELNQKLHQLALSIAYYNLYDVWNKYTAGLTVRSHGSIANDALDRWRRVYKTELKLKSK